MKQHLRTLALSLFGVMTFSAAVAQEVVYEKVTIRTLNEYPEPITNVSQIPLHPYAAKTNPTVAAKKVEFTAIVSSYPKNSGLASYNTDGSIGRLHVFVTDTNAAALGRDYMSLQIVESYGAGQFGDAIENLQLGDIATFRGNITFFSGTVQFDVDEVIVANTTEIRENGVWEARYLPLLRPVTVNLSDVLMLDDQNRWVPNLANYGKYSGMYVKFVDVNVAARVFPSSNLRPYFSIQKNGLRLYTNDISLRYRNDRAAYKAGFNRRRPVSQSGEGDFVPPANGALVDASGYLWFGTAFPAEASPTQTFRIAMMDDGKLWEGDVLKESGKTYGGEEFFWPNDLTVKGTPPGFSNFTQSKIIPKSTDKVTVTVTILPEGATTLSKVELIYKKDTEADVVVALTGTNNVYTYEFPTFATGSSVTYRIEATGSDGLVGQLGPNTFVVVDVVTDIALIQRTADGGKGPSPFAGLGDVTADLTATVVSDATDGIIVIHQSNQQFKGVIVTPSDSTRKLVKGDVINVKLLEVFETATNIDGITRVVLKDFAKTGTGAYTSLIPTLTTNNARANPTNITLQGEQWEGMVVKLVNVAVINRQADSQTGGGDFGEFEVFTTNRPDTIKGDRYNTGFRINEDLPNANLHTGASNRFFGNDVNENIRRGSVFASITGVYYTGFGNPKLTPLGGLTGMVAGTDPNWSVPKRNITTTFPATAAIEADKDVVVEWSTSVDFDGGNVRYWWAATTASDVNFATPLVRVKSDTTETGASLPKVTIKGSQLLSAIGENRSLIWTVYMSDGKDTVQAANLSTALANLPTNNVYTNKSFPLSISNPTSSEDNAKFTFALSQNFPNPFNPATTIRYSVADVGQVKLSVYDMLGRLVAVPVNNRLSAGAYTVNFDASMLSSGIYIYRLEQGSNVLTRKMILMK